MYAIFYRQELVYLFAGKTKTMQKEFKKNVGSTCFIVGDCSNFQ